MEGSTKRRAPSPNQETKGDSQEAGTSPRETPLVEMMAGGPDLTEQARLDAQLMHATNLLFLRTTALNTAAHELRNSLTIISGATEVMLMHPDDNKVHTECANTVQIATEHASVVLENSLQSARSLYSDKTEVDITAILEKSIYLLTHQMVLQNITLQKEFQSNLPRVSGNPVALQQVFINLITNALKAMPRGGTLTVVSRALETQYVEIQFRDTGRGIRRKYLLESSILFLRHSQRAKVWAWDYQSVIALSSSIREPSRWRVRCVKAARLHFGCHARHPHEQETVPDSPCGR